MKEKVRGGGDKVGSKNENHQEAILGHPRHQALLSSSVMGQTSTGSISFYSDKVTQCLEWLATHKPSIMGSPGIDERPEPLGSRRLETVSGLCQLR